jgi:plasmid stability protein
MHALQSLPEDSPMASMTIRNLDDDLKTLLRLRAARHGQSMEEEARSILRGALRADALSGQALVDSIRAMVTPHGGIELELPPRELQRDPPDFL